MIVPRLKQRRKTPGKVVPLLNVSRPPDAPLKETHKWADWVELRACVAPDGSVTVGDLAAWLRVDESEAPDASAGDSPEETAIAQEEDNADAYLARDASSTDETDDGQRAAGRVDNRERMAEDVFRLLRHRQSLFGENYPFELTGNEDRLDCLATKSPGREAYMLLLLCASGRYVTNHGLLAKDFERICVPVLQSIFPAADVQVFGTAGSSSGDYAGSFVTRLNKLAENLGEMLQATADDVDDDENGDRGLDVVAIQEMGDNLPGKIVVFAQAACTDDWVSKQDSPSHEAWDQLVLPLVPTITACCIPHSYRGSDGGWRSRTKIHRRLLLDRSRILHLLGDDVADHLANYVRNRAVITEVLAFEEV